VVANADDELRNNTTSAIAKTKRNNPHMIGRRQDGEAIMRRWRRPNYAKSHNPDQLRLSAVIQNI
jgi:hypothetical protein